MAKKRITISDVAREAQVSETAVSLAFKDGSRISERTRRRIREAAERLSYFPDSAARRLRFGTSKSIGLIVTDITNPYHATMVRIADQIVKGSGYQLIIAESNWDAKTEVDVTLNMIENRVLGLLMCFCEKTDQSYRLIKQSGIPHVAVDTMPSFYEGAYVLSDHLYAGAAAAKHLLLCGCERPAFFTSEPGIGAFSTFALLKKGFLAALRKAGMESRAVPIVDAGLSISRGREAYGRLRDSGAEVDGVFCVNDLCAIGVIEEAKARGVEVGKNLKVIGIDNLDFSALETVSLTSFADPREQIMKAAANFLIRCIEDETSPDIRRKYRSRLVERASARGA
jgi:LacI family transcriptional regulator